MSIAKLTTTALSFLATTLPATAQSAADIVELLCGRTVHFYSDFVGNQIEFTDPDGNAYLWHPIGDGGVIAGTWRLEHPQGGEVEVCYHYPDDSFGPGGGGDHCFTYLDLLDDIPLDGIRDGDPYNLSSGAAPFALPAFPPLPAQGLAEQFPDVVRGPGCAAYVS